MHCSREFISLVCNNKKYQIVEQIGDGAFGMVFHATWSKRTHLNGYEGSDEGIYNTNSVALKLIQLRTANERESFINEIYFAETLRSDKVINLIESYKFTFKGEEFGVLCYEKMDMDLMDYILMKGRLSESEAKDIFRDICLSLAHCHRNSIAHLDLKPENILLNFSPLDRSVRSIKLCDFGFTKKFNSSSKIVYKNCSRNLIGTKEYRAPEIKKKRLFGLFEKNLSFYADKADMWSLGATLFVMITGCFPFEEDITHTMNYNNYNSNDQPDMRFLNKIKYFCANDRCVNLITRLMDLSPRKRLGIMDVMNDPWLDFDDFSTISFTYSGCEENVDKVESDFSEVEEQPFFFTPRPSANLMSYTI